MRVTWQHLVLIGLLLTAALASRIVPAGEDRTLVLIVTTVLAAIFGPAAMNKQQNEQLDDQDKKLSDLQRTTTQVQQQTNGVLDKRIQDGVRAVLDERDRTLGMPVRRDPTDEG